jgi:orotidine-5'-phosphate decarboxylase
MTQASQKNRRPRPLATTTNPGLGAARRAAISAIVGEDVEAFAQARRAAQRGLVHALEQAETIAEIRRRHCAFALDAARAYAAYAARFDAVVDDFDCKPAEEEA